VRPSRQAIILATSLPLYVVAPKPAGIPLSPFGLSINRKICKYQFSSLWFWPDL